MHGEKRVSHFIAVKVIMSGLAVIQPLHVSVDHPFNVV